MKFKEFLKEARISRGLSQKALADMMHLEPQAISNYERGIRKCSFNMAIEFLNALEIDIEIRKGEIIILDSSLNNKKEKRFFEEKNGVLYIYADYIKYGEIQKRSLY